jgi:hypothetical protein
MSRGSAESSRRQEPDEIIGDFSRADVNRYVAECLRVVQP